MFIDSIKFLNIFNKLDNINKINKEHHSLLYKPYHNFNKLFASLISLAITLRTFLS